MAETPAGMLNAIGLQNIGAEAFVRDKLPELRASGVTVVANCWGNTVEEYAEVAAMLDVAEGLAAIEINVSSPNKREWGRIIAVDPVRTADVVRAVRGKTRLPLWVKLSPNVTEIGDLARAAEAEGADTLVVANTYTGMAVDLRTRRPVLTNVTGGLSGPAIKPLSLRATYQVTHAVSIPVIGVGGISTGEDALEYLLVGARAIQVGTASLYDPAATTRIVNEIQTFLRREAIADVNDLVGALIVN
jgi:dihydroorotate dehydrogenase (NAD+) catalytic subunit